MCSTEKHIVSISSSGRRRSGKWMEGFWREVSSTYLLFIVVVEPWMRVRVADGARNRYRKWSKRHTFKKTTWVRSFSLRHLFVLCVRNVSSCVAYNPEHDEYSSNEMCMSHLQSFRMNEPTKGAGKKIWKWKTEQRLLFASHSQMLHVRCDVRAGCTRIVTFLNGTQHQMRRHSRSKSHGKDNEAQ